MPGGAQVEIPGYNPSGVTKLGAALLVYGVLSFVLPMLGVTHAALGWFGASQKVVSLCCGVAGVVLLLAGIKKDSG